MYIVKVCACCCFYGGKISCYGVPMLMRVCGLRVLLQQFASIIWGSAQVSPADDPAYSSPTDTEVRLGRGN